MLINVYYVKKMELVLFVMLLNVKENFILFVLMLKDGALSQVKRRKVFQRLQKQVILPSSGIGPVESEAAVWHEAERSSIHKESPSLGVHVNRIERDGLPEGYFMKDMTEDLARIDSVEESVRAMY